jgi:hypothetical protein
MSTPRQPVRDAYDAVVDLATLGADAYPSAYALVKFTLTMAEPRCQPAPPVPLGHDLRDPDLKPRVLAGTDFWPVKEATDVVVLGAAYPPRGRPAPGMQVAVKVGAAEKRVQVFGTRRVEWSGGRPKAFTDPEPFEDMPLTDANAYGGIDWRVPWPDGERRPLPLDHEFDHPGLYPRNPFGKGYLVEPGAVPDLELPNLEDPGHLLTPERLLTGDARHWWRQPLPWTLGWVAPVTFPRYVFYHPEVDAWYPAPQDGALPEVARGLLETGYRARMALHDVGTGPHPRFFQEASAGLVVRGLAAGTPVELRGLSSVHSVIRFELPAPLATLEFEIDGRREKVAPRLHSVICEPAAQRVSLVYGGNCRLPRLFIPGIHKHVPVAVRVNGDAPVPYLAPPPARETLAAAQAKGSA